MHVIVTKDATEIATLLSNIIIGVIKQKPKPILGLATGSSPIATYQMLVADHQKHQTDWSHVTTFNLDEYVGLGQTDVNSYYYFMIENLFQHLNIKKANINLPNGVGDGTKNAHAYEALINKSEPIDLQILGLGANCHIGFNEPGSAVTSKTRVVDLTPTTIAANQRFFQPGKEVPKQAITMGIATILKAKNIVVVATGQTKAAAVKELVQGVISPNWPCTFLQNHPSVIVFVDEAAASLLTPPEMKASKENA